MFCRAYGGYLVRCCGSGTSSPSQAQTQSQAQSQAQSQGATSSDGGVTIGGWGVIGGDSGAASANAIEDTVLTHTSSSGDLALVTSAGFGPSPGSGASPSAGSGASPSAGSGPSPSPCAAVFHPLCGWFQGVYVDTIVTDPTFQGADRTGRYPSGLKSRFLCEEHGPKGTKINTDINTP